MINQRTTPAVPGTARRLQRTSARVLAVVLAALVLPFGVQGTAAAAGDGNPVIVGPTGTIAYNSAPDVTVDFSNAPLGDYEVHLTSDDWQTDAYETVSYTGDYDVLTVQMPTGPLSSGWYTVEVTSLNSDTYSWTQGRFAVGAAPRPPLTITSSPASPASFYPTVQDGYADSTTVDFSTNRTARVVARVLDSGGRVVRSADLGNRSGASWTWNGRKNNGTMAATGWYKLTLTASVTSAPAGTVTTSRGVRLTTGYKTTTVDKYRTGYDTSSASSSTNCYTDYWSSTSELTLDCWGGSYAKARYGFSIPSNAYDVSWGVAGYQGCCSTGTISKTGTRSSARTSFSVTVRVTDWRSYTVQKVRVTYTTKRRI